MTSSEICILSQKYQQINIVQDQKLILNEIKFGDFIVAMRAILNPSAAAVRLQTSSTVVEDYLTQVQITETQKEVTKVLNSVIQNIIKDTEITWSLDDAVDIFMTTGSGHITGNF